MYDKKIKLAKRTLVLIASGLILLTVAVGGTIAYIIAQTSRGSNEFIPVEVNCKIEETFKDNVKHDVCVRNTGDIDAYIRAIVVANWVSEPEDGKILSTAPVEGADYSVEWGTDGWLKGSDGFWYYTNAVAVQDVTKDLIEKVNILTYAPEGYRLHVQILASAIQATPVFVVEQEWGMTVRDGVLTPSE